MILDDVERDGAAPLPMVVARRQVDEVGPLDDAMGPTVAPRIGPEE
jgi:hypothetical protein